MANDSAATPQARVQDAVDRLVADGGEVGLQVAVIHRGDLVVDAVAGLADAGRGVPVTPDTLFFATSTAKGVASAVAHVLVERGELTYDLRVADVWPEFAAHGKGGTTLRHVLHFGVPPALLDRVARQEAAPGVPLHHPDPGTPASRAVPPATLPTADLANRRDVLTSDLVSMGTMTARGVARVYAGLLGHAEVALVSPDRLTDLARPAYEGPDEVMGLPDTTWAFGFSEYRPGDVPVRPGSTFGMAGGNGSAAWADIDSGLAVAVMRNRFSSDWSTAGEIDRLVAELFSTRPRGARS